MAVRFQADADLSQIIVAAVLRRSPDIDFQTAHAASLGGLKDIEVLGMAASEERILVTHDSRTMPTHFAEFVRSQHSPGVIVVPQSLAVPAAAEDLALIWAATTPEEWENLSKDGNKRSFQGTEQRLRGGRQSHSSGRTCRWRDFRSRARTNPIAVLLASVRRTHAMS